MPLPPFPKDAGKIAGAVDIHQSSCWHCHAMWFQPAVIEDYGLRCAYCGELNYYGAGFKKAQEERN